ncbi:hypothetical protein ACHAP5_012158 [Fusarium lateritium]
MWTSSMWVSHPGATQQPPVRHFNLSRGGRVITATGIITGVVAALVWGTGRGGRPGAGLVSFPGHQRCELRLEDAQQHRTRLSLREDIHQFTRPSGVVKC